MGMNGGWRHPLPVYEFTCPKHGLMRDIPRGYEEALVCPECCREVDDGLNDRHEKVLRVA